MSSKSRAAIAVLFLLLLQLVGCDGPGLTPLAPDARILAFGDSLTYGTGAGREQAYPAVLSAFTGLEVVNAGVPGEVSEAGLARLPALLDRHQPDLVVLVHGGNDTLRKLPASSTRNNLRAMIEMCRDSGAQVIMLGVPGRKLTLSVADYYTEVAEAMDVPIDDSVLPRLMRDRDYKSDAVHFNAEGYRRMAEGVHELLLDAGAL